MATPTPDIGTTISDGYSRGIDRLSSQAPGILVPAAIVSLVAAGIAQLQVQLVPDATDILGSILSGDGFSEADLRTIQLLGAISGLVSLVGGLVGYALIGGGLHRERHGEDATDILPGTAFGESMAIVGKLMPKLMVLAALFVVSQAGGVVLGILGSLLGAAAGIYFLYLIIRWVYTPIIVGAGEAEGDAAFGRSSDAVSGAWWRTFGIFIVVGLATLLPIAVGSAIVGWILPGAFLSTLGSSLVGTMVGWSVFAASLESAWAQVEAASTPPTTDPYHQEATPPAEPPSSPASDDDAPPNPPAGPFV